MSSAGTPGPPGQATVPPARPFHLLEDVGGGAALACLALLPTDLDKMGSYQ